MYGVQDVQPWLIVPLCRDSCCKHMSQRIVLSTGRWSLAADMCLTLSTAVPVLFHAATQQQLVETQQQLGQSQQQLGETQQQAALLQQQLEEGQQQLAASQQELEEARRQSAESQQREDPHSHRG
jgi:septal ring factor EnvC (AmiA/AmiB activator)